MELSFRAIELCRKKYGKGYFCGFEHLDEVNAANLYEISKEEAREDFNELEKSGMIDFHDGAVHISPLGQHIFNMMLQPEQYIRLDNMTDERYVKIYIRNGYYLCVLQKRGGYSDTAKQIYQIKLLPRLELVIGSFAYALHHKKISHSEEKQKADSDKNEIQIEALAWGRDKNVLSQCSIDGCFRAGEIACIIDKKTSDQMHTKEKLCLRTDELVNKITVWMFNQFSAVEKKGEC